MKPCGWYEEDGVWNTDCHNEFVINEETPKSNGMKYCCFCGKLLKEFPEEKEEC